MKKKKTSKKIEKLSLQGFYLILAGVVLSIIFNSGVIDLGIEPLKWIGFLLLVAGMVMLMIPALRDKKKERAEKKKLAQKL